ncbi:hypothetical protein JCM9534A_03640 [Catenuloplanes indicus JCM 9534]
MRTGEEYRIDAGEDLGRRQRLADGADHHLYLGRPATALPGFCEHPHRVPGGKQLPCQALSDKPRGAAALILARRDDREEFDVPGDRPAVGRVRSVHGKTLQELAGILRVIGSDAARATSAHH